MNQRRVPYREFETYVNRFRVRDILIRCNAMANQVDRSPLGQVQVPVKTASRFAPVVNTAVSPWGLAFIARTSLLRSTDRRQRELTEEAFNQLIHMHGNLDEVLFQDEDVDSFLFRTAWEQFPLQEGYARLIPRTLMMLVDANEELGDPLDLKATWPKTSGLTLEQFIRVGFAYLAGLSKFTSVSRHFAASGVFAGVVTEEECEAFLRMTSATYEEFRNLSKPFRGDELFVRTEFNVLTQRPLIVVGDELVASVPKLLLHRFTKGVVYDLKEHFEGKNRNRFSEYFGRLFEQYCGDLLYRAFGTNHRIIQEPVYGKPEKLGPDWIVIDGDCAMLFECRTSGFTLNSKAIADQGQVLADMRRILSILRNGFHRKWSISRRERQVSI